MKRITVRTKRWYNACLDNISNLAAAIRENLDEPRSDAVIISDDMVWSLYGGAVETALQDVFDTVSNVIIKAREQDKHFGSVVDLYGAFMRLGVNRRTVIVTLGGGVLGDLAGFAASTFMRGVRLVHIPTTLVAQADSAIGGKTGVDYDGVKNLIGSFYQPEMVFIDVGTLKTLPERHIKAGLGEVIKYGVIRDRGLLNSIKQQREGVLSLDRDICEQIVTRCCEIKAEVVSGDETDKGMRHILNFGHTFGHALESAWGYNVLHGTCVAYGMMAALRVSFLKGGISEEHVDEIRSLMSDLGLFLGYLPEAEKESIYKTMCLDKKNTGSVALVLINAEKPYTCRDAPKELILNGIDYMLSIKQPQRRF